MKAYILLLLASQALTSVLPGEQLPASPRRTGLIKEADVTNPRRGDCDGPSYASCSGLTGESHPCDYATDYGRVGSIEPDDDPRFLDYGFTTGAQVRDFSACCRVCYNTLGCDWYRFDASFVPDTTRPNADDNNNCAVYRGWYPADSVSRFNAPIDMSGLCPDGIGDAKITRSRAPQFFISQGLGPCVRNIKIIESPRD